MNKRWILLGGIVSGLALVWVLLVYGASQRPATVHAQDGGPTSDEGEQLQATQQPAASDEIPPADLQADGQPASPAAPITGTYSLVYFTPQDNDANGTVVTVYNTSDVTITVNLQAFSTAGNPPAEWNITLGPRRLKHLVSDSLAASPPPSWDPTNTIVTNFTDFTTYAVLAIPAGVKLDGYLIYNPGTGTVDPRADQGAIPLRFSTDPLMVLLPSVMKSP